MTNIQNPPVSTDTFPIWNLRSSCLRNLLRGNGCWKQKKCAHGHSDMQNCMKTKGACPADAGPQAALHLHGMSKDNKSSIMAMALNSGCIVCMAIMHCVCCLPQKSRVSASLPLFDAHVLSSTQSEESNVLCHGDGKQHVISIATIKPTNRLLSLPHLARHISY